MRNKKLITIRTNVALVFTTILLTVAAATTVATAQTYKDLHNFGNGVDGVAPLGTLAQVRDGDLYGTTQEGGTNQCTGNSNLLAGVVFKITPRGSEKVFYNFNDTYGCDPYGGLTLAGGGDLYGTAFYGGGSINCGGGCGTIFKIAPSTLGNLTDIHAFNTSYPETGIFPLTPPIVGADGSFYGVTNRYGEVYKITPSGSLTLLAPTSSAAPLLLGTDGNFYGTSGGGTFGDGVVFEMTPQGTLTTLYDFDGTHGTSPNLGALIQDIDGNFYGVTEAGGSYGDGVAFQLTPQGAITVLHNFGDPNYPNDGTSPSAGLVQATDGNFYGVTNSGGTMGYGVIFQITSAGTYSLLYDFDGTHGANPQSTPMQHTNGKIYGLTTSGGTYGGGVVYSFDMSLAPFVSLVPTMGKVKRVIQVIGQGFKGTTGALFNGTPANFIVVTDTFLKATVPAGATTGFVTVTTPGGKLTSNKEFQVEP